MKLFKNITSKNDKLFLMDLLIAFRSKFPSLQFFVNNKTPFDNIIFFSPFLFDINMINIC